MHTRKCLIAVSFYTLMALNQNLFSQITLTGIVRDNGSVPVENALVKLTDQADPSHYFSDYTDNEGRYVISISENGVEGQQTSIPGAFKLSQNYPNPFNPSTVIAYELAQPANIRIDINNVLGQKIKTLFDGYHASMSGIVVWDATDEKGRGVPAGVYIYSLTVRGTRINRKMLLIDGGRGLSTLKLSKPSESRNVLNKSMSDQYQLRITGTDIETYELPEIQITENKVFNVTVFRMSTDNTVTDIDGNVYRTVKISNQWWMAENLKVTHYQNGDAIPNVTDYTEWSILTTGAYGNYNNDTNNMAIYGRLYNWYVGNDSRNIAPPGWHISSDAEWQTLLDYLGGDSIAGGKMKEIGTSHWADPNTGATNESGFSALPCGWGWFDGGFTNLGYTAYFWSSTGIDTNSAWARHLGPYSSEVFRSNHLKRSGFSIRCIQD